MIVAFTYFYTAITVNPNQMADDMKKNGGFIPGIKPGKKTAEFIDNVMSRITFPGSIFFGIGSYHAGICWYCWCKPAVCRILRRYLSIDFGGSGT